ncbi:hypothetical protein BHE74_00005421 [Ensete ventricosum]|nr:hypothetical protein BHE74_00005421 [Ensete ventricosum]
MEALGSSARHPARTYGVPDMTSRGKRCLLTPDREGSGSTRRMGISGCTVWGAAVGVPMGALAVEYFVICDTKLLESLDTERFVAHLMGHQEEPPSAAQESLPPPPPPHEGQRAIPTPFLTKTYQLVDDPCFDDVISWNEDGSTFVVWQPAEFACDVLPKYFKHNNFSSFVRQLNTYVRSPSPQMSVWSGFRKIASDRWEFANECFRRAEKGLLCDIHRRKFSPTAIPSAAPVNLVMSSETSGVEQVRSTTSSPGDFQPELAAVAAWASPGSSDGASELAEENSRLRRENKQLSQELGQMKSLCTNIMQLMAKYATWKNGAEATTDVSGGADASPPLEAGGSSGERGSTRLFGVSIGLKRNRGEDGGVASTSAAAMVDDGMVPIVGKPFASDFSVHRTWPRLSEQVPWTWPRSKNKSACIDVFSLCRLTARTYKHKSLTVSAGELGSVSGDLFAFPSSGLDS